MTKNTILLGFDSGKTEGSKNVSSKTRRYAINKIMDWSYLYLDLKLTKCSMIRLKKRHNLTLNDYFILICT